MTFKAGVFVWTVANDYGARIPDDDTKGAMSVSLFKVNDGMNRMETVAEAVALAQQYRAQGIDFMPWGVARGFSLAGAKAEGALAGEYAAATNSPYVLDLEPYPDDYWQGIPGTPQAFIEGYNSTANRHPLRLCPDARNSGLNLEKWVAAQPGAIWHPQAYYTAFHMPMNVGIMAAIRPLLNAGIPVAQIYPVLPLYIDTPGEPSIPGSEVKQAINLVAQWGYPGIAFWRRGLMSPDQVSTMLAMDDPFTPAPPPPGPSLKQQALAAIEVARQSVEEMPD